MKRLLAVFAGGLGIGALLRRRRRRSVPAVEPESSLAEELRSKLAESRAAEAKAVATRKAADAAPAVKTLRAAEANLTKAEDVLKGAERALEVASEKAVSRESEILVMDGAASDSLMACMVAIPVFQLGKK